MENQHSSSSPALAEEPNSSMALMAGLQPAFRHRVTGESHLAINDAGFINNTYSFTGLPKEWIVERDEAGMPLALHPDVVPGYWRDAKFISLDDLTQLPFDA